MARPELRAVGDFVVNMYVYRVLAKRRRELVRRPRRTIDDTGIKMSDGGTGNIYLSCLGWIS
jgi:hypothetical protein